MRKNLDRAIKFSALLKGLTLSVLTGIAIKNSKKTKKVLKKKLFK